MFFRGNILDNGQVIRSGVTGEMEAKMVGTLMERNGYFDLPPGPIGLAQSRRYELRLDDGQAFTFFITNINPGEHVVRVFFAV